MSSYADHIAANARLIILRHLAGETSLSANDSLIHAKLETFGHRRPREFTRTQILALREIGAVTVVEAGSALIATLTQAGLDHVERRSVLSGVQRPSPEA